MGRISIAWESAIRRSMERALWMTSLSGLKAQFPDVEFDFYQSNHEGALVDKISQLAEDDCQGIVFNPGAYSHTSIALRDAISGSNIPTIEVHISNIHARERFRHHSHTGAVSQGVIAGLGIKGYQLATGALLDKG